MIRSGFKRKPPAAYVKAERIAPVHARLTVKVNMPRADGETGSIPKAAPARSEAYRRLVAAMPCAHCGIVGYSQAAHGDFSKGAHIKSDDRTCYPAHLQASTTSAVGKEAGKRGGWKTKSRCAKIAASKRKTGKLTMEIAREIRMSSESGPVLAARHGVDRSLINGIKAGTRWRDYSSPFAGLMA